jgi:hypothetical protein
MPVSPPPRQYLSNAIRKRGSALLHQQCWLWGQDIKRTEGNLLLAHGFERIRPPDGVAGSSQYTLAVAGDFSVRLWGFGIYFGAGTGIFLNRFEFIPREARRSDLWQAREMTALPRARDFSLLAQTLRWIGAYEAWVLRTLGPEHRKTCLIGWPGAATSPGSIAEAWNELAAQIERSQLVAGAAGCRIAPAKGRLTYNPHTPRKERTHGRSHESRAAASA